MKASYLDSGLFSISCNLPGGGTYDIRPISPLMPACHLNHDTSPNTLGYSNPNEPESGRRGPDGVLRLEEALRLRSLPPY